jgi:hypothetical protein
MHESRGCGAGQVQYKGAYGRHAWRLVPRNSDLVLVGAASEGNHFGIREGCDTVGDAEAECFALRFNDLHDALCLQHRVMCDSIKNRWPFSAERAEAAVQRVGHDVRPKRECHVRARVRMHTHSDQLSRRNTQQHGAARCVIGCARDGVASAERESPGIPQQKLGGGAFFVDGDGEYGATGGSEEAHGGRRGVDTRRRADGRGGCSLEVERRLGGAHVLDAEATVVRSPQTDVADDNFTGVSAPARDQIVVSMGGSVRHVRGRAVGGEAESQVAGGAHRWHLQVVAR